MAKKVKVNKTKAVQEYLRGTSRGHGEGHCRGIAQRWDQDDGGARTLNIKSKLKRQRRQKRVAKAEAAPAAPLAASPAAPMAAGTEKTAKAADAVTIEEIRKVAQTVKSIGSFSNASARYWKSFAKWAACAVPRTVRGNHGAQQRYPLLTPLAWGELPAGSLCTPPLPPRRRPAPGPSRCWSGRRAGSSR